MLIFTISCIVLWISIPITVYTYVAQYGDNSKPKHSFYFKIFFSISLLFSFIALTTGEPPALDIANWFSEPNLDVPYDLDCSDVREEVWVGDHDPHRLDRDGDGWGCESYG
jgi:hypothetical protein